MRIGIAFLCLWVPRLGLTSLLLMPFSYVAHAQEDASRADVANLRKQFRNPPDDCRIMMRWWWFGSAVTKPELEREMRLMKEGGIGGFEVQPVYPVALDDAATGIRNLPFLSDEFIDALRFTSEKARVLGLRMDLTLGSGWPYGGPQVSVSLAAGKLRCVRVKVTGGSQRVPTPDVGAGERLLAVFMVRSEGRSIVPETQREITDIRDGAVRLPAGLVGDREIFFFISSRTGQMVKRPAIGAEGFVLDHYDRASIDNYLKKVGGRLMQAFDSHPPHAIFCDSLEVYDSDWTGGLLEEFRNRRGYDLKPYLPALVADIGPQTAAIRHDWGKTLTELLNEYFIAPVRDWARQNHTLFRLQGYGTPPATLSSNVYPDLPEGEGAQWKSLCASRWASSANHIYGRPVTSSETWTWLHSPSFRATPLDVKAEADLHFLQGINQLIGHGWPYTAEGVEYPGWRFYAAGVFNDKNPWWIVMPDLSLYLQRISFLMRQGRPVSDVALYLPNSDAWASFTNGRVNIIESLRQRIGPDVISRVLESGFDLDFFDDDALRQVGRIEAGALMLGEGRYKIVILPNVERIPFDTLKKLDEFARAGGVLIATRRVPNLAPGRMETAAEREQIREISRRLFEGPSAPARFVEDENRQLAGRLTDSVQPHVSFSPAAPEVGFVHRSTGGTEIYFIVNTANVPIRTKATFRVRELKPEWWNPLTGTTLAADVEEQTDRGSSVQLNMEPYGSRVLVFSKGTLPSSRTQSTAAVPEPLDLSTGWRVSFASGATLTMDRLRSWTENVDTRYFSGLATYQKNVVVPEGMLRDGMVVKLDFGEGRPVSGQHPDSHTQAWINAPVREAAVIYVNERRAGSVWCPPYSIDVTDLLHRGNNSLRVVVGNLAINYMAGRALPDYRLLNLRYGVRFEPQDMKDLQPVPAGLFGPIRLIPVTVKEEQR